MAFTQEVVEPKNEDDMVVDDFAEEDELEAMFMSYEEQRARAPSPTMSDEEYDDIFAELISQEQQTQPHSFSDAMESMEPMETTGESMDIT